MYQMRLLGLLLRPSWLSFIATLALAIFILGATNWHYIMVGFLPGYDFILSTYDSTKVLQEAPSRLNALLLTISAKSIAYNMLVFVAAILIGMIVYGIMRLIGGFFSSANNSLQQIIFAAPAARKAVEAEIGLRLGFRAVSLLAWFAYWLFSINILLPYCIFTFRIGVIDVYSPANIAYSLIGIGLAMLTIHMHLVFARLVALRPRLFGDREILEEYYESH